MDEPDRTAVPRDQALRGAHVLVTGAASGIGRQVCSDLVLREGAHVRLLDVDEAGLRSVAAKLGARARAGSVLSGHGVDLGDRDAVAALAGALAGTRLDVLIHVAGIVSVGPFEQTALPVLERVVDVDLLGPLRLTHALLPLLLASARASLVLVASAAGLVGGPGLAAYSAAKFGLVGLAQALRAELHGRVAVSTVCPTLVRTGLVDHAQVGRDPASGRDRRAGLDRVLTRHGASPEKVSRAIVRAIVERRGLVLVNPDAVLLYHLHRLFPRTTEAVVLQGYRWLLRRGVLPG